MFRYYNDLRLLPTLLISNDTTHSREVSKPTCICSRIMPAARIQDLIHRARLPSSRTIQETKIDDEQG